MIALALKGLEAALNKVLRLDPQTLKKLQSLDSKSIKIDITDWNIAFYILPYAQGIQLLADYHEAPSTIITGKLFNLVKVGAARATTTSMFDESISISGDTKTGEIMRDILKNIDIDWEEQLSKVVGDTMAHPIAKGLKKLFRFAKRSTRSVSENVTEYLHYESKQLPPKNAVEHFIEEVATLRDDIDRMDAKIQHLQQRKQPK